MRSGSAHTVDYSNPTHFITKYDLGFGLRSRVPDNGWIEVEGRLFFETRRAFIAALERSGYLIVDNGVWEPTSEQKALAEIRVIVARIQWKVKPGSLLPEEGLALISEVLDREVRRG